MCLEDLINYFAQPEEDMGKYSCKIIILLYIKVPININYWFFTIEHEEKQNRFRALRNRQDLFQEEGILNLILEAIDKVNIITSQGFMVSLAGDESGQSWDVISGYLYQLLG
jgi:ryanodine receptor 2